MRMKILLSTLPKHVKEALKTEEQMYHMVPMLLPQQEDMLAKFTSEAVARRLPHRVRREGFIMKGRRGEIAILQFPMVAVPKETVYEIAKKIQYVK